MKYITKIVKYFAFITTGIVVLIGVLMLIQGEKYVSADTLIKIPCAGLATSAVTVLLYPSEDKSKKGYMLGVLLHYIVLCIVMIIFGAASGWIKLNIGGILLMIISTAAVYAFTSVVSYISSKNDADELNRALKHEPPKE